MMAVYRFVSTALCGIALSLLCTMAWAQDGEFYRGKTIELIISSGVGDAVDTSARIVARHLPRFIPGQPNIVPKNMPGAGHVIAANYLYNRAAKDGTALGALVSGFVLAQLLESTGVRFDANKFEWLTSVTSSNSVIYVWHTSTVRTIHDAMERPVITGGTGAGSLSVIYPTVINKVLGTRFKLVTGYKDSASLRLAMERDEIEARGGASLSSLRADSPDALKEGKLIMLAQGGFERDPEFPDIPLLSELATSDRQRGILRLLQADVFLGRPILTAPGVPPERVALLRGAFATLLTDPEFINDQRQAGLDVQPTTGAKLQETVAAIFATPPDLVAEFRKAVLP